MGISKSGNDDEIVTLLAGHQAAMLAFTHSLLPGDPGVKDVVQRANLVLWRKRSEYQSGTSFKSWAFRIIHWEVKAYLKESSRKSWLIVDEELTHMVVDSMLEQEEQQPLDALKASLESCLQKLNPKHQRLVTHRYFTRKTLQEFSEEVQQPVTSLKTTLGRIRIALRKCIDAQLNIQSIQKPS
ncbi:sigma-70 family RNA polymerase sigma factor [Rubritalea tangerina]|uniref:Sigma-70 family RNA polymerase sigma factor n=1 Tax=Rubritalea tangerina TaxID=430798 RepID=A0ABW4ZBF1_9BACT